MSDSEWAKRTLQSYRDVIAAKTQEDAVFLEKQRIIKDSIDELWTQLESALRSKCNAVNFQAQQEIITFETMKPRTISLRRKGFPSKTIQCDQKTQEIEISILDKKPPDNIFLFLTVEVDKDSGRGYLAREKTRREPEKLAESVIEELLKFDS